MSRKVSYEMNIIRYLKRYLRVSREIISLSNTTWCVQVLRYPNFSSGMGADRNVKVAGGDVAVL